MKSISFRNNAFWGITLLVSLILLIFFLPLVRDPYQARVSRILYSMLFISALFTLDRKIKPLLFLMLTVFIMEWVAGIFTLPILNTVSKSLNVVFFVAVVSILIGQVAMARHVTFKVILGSVIGYLLLGLVFTIFVTYIMEYDPDAFNVTQNPVNSSSAESWLSESIYFTFVSLATLGYGDILPLKPYTRSLSILITVSGQLYIAIIIALLVGKFASGHGPTFPGHNDSTQ